MTTEEKIQNRQKANLELLKILEEQILNNPTERFHQILRNSNFVKETRPKDTTEQIQWVNWFYAEPVDVLQLVKAAKYELDNNKRRQSTT